MNRALRLNAKELSRRRRFDPSLMLRLPVPLFHVSVHFTRVVVRFLQVFILWRLGKIRVVLTFLLATFLPEG